MRIQAVFQRKKVDIDFIIIQVKTISQADLIGPNVPFGKQNVANQKKDDYHYRISD
jgi:hypothetical protein